MSRCPGRGGAEGSRTRALPKRLEHAFFGAFPDDSHSENMDAGICYRRVWLWSLASALLVLFCPGLRAATLISKGAGWRYLDSGIDQGTDWRELWFDDDSWGFGHGELGYGDDIDGRPE